MQSFHSLEYGFRGDKMDAARRRAAPARLDGRIQQQSVSSKDNSRIYFAKPWTVAVVAIMTE